MDLYHVICELQALGHETHLFVAGCEASWERGTVDPARLPFPATRVDFQPRELNRRVLPERLRAAVDAWAPEAVYLGDGFFLKPYVAEALRAYPMVSRYYAYELACPRDLRLFLNGAPCPMNYLRTPGVCRPCALQGLKPEITAWRFLSWAGEYLAARAFMPGYHERLAASLRRFKTIVVYNPVQREHLRGFHDDVRIVPGGVDLAEFSCAPAPGRRPGEPKIILMTGRVEDPAKGFQTLRDAGARLARNRSDFVIHVTHTDPAINTPWLQAVGWHDHAALREYYARADICVAPSIWQEPFGLVAVEAMASGRPVVVSRVGGLQHIVVDGESGLLFDPGDADGLAECLARLLDDDALRQRMGAAARARAEAEYDWKRLVAAHYPPILEGLLHG